MSIEEKKERMARNYAINSTKTPRTRRVAFAAALAVAIPMPHFGELNIAKTT